MEFEQKYAGECFLPSAASVTKNPEPLFDSTHFYSLISQKSDFLSSLVLFSAGNDANDKSPDFRTSQSIKL